MKYQTMTVNSFSNVIGFDDCPFHRSYKGDVRIVGAVYANVRFDGVLSGHIRRDGSDAAKNIAKLVAESKFMEHAQLILLQGVTLGGFNVVDVHELSNSLQLPVLVVARYEPDMTAVKKALLENIHDGIQKWKLIEKLGPMEPACNVFVQRVGLTLEQAEQTISKFAIHSHIPEPLRAAHIIAGGLATGQSRGRP